jgi:molybdate transport system substrate-binding protein
MIRFFIFCFALLSATFACAAEVSVAVAGNFAVPMQKIAVAFEAKTAHRVRLASGSTGRFFSQIKAGAPFDLLVAADNAVPKQLETLGFTVVGTREAYARGRLVLWSAKAQVVDHDAKVLQAIGPGDRLAIADPKVAPYGRAAQQVLNRLGLASAWRPHIVQGESIAQTFQFVATGNAKLGFVALSQTKNLGGSSWLVPAHLHDPIIQELVVVKRGVTTQAAIELAKFFKGPEAQAIMSAYGYEVP